MRLLLAISLTFGSVGASVIQPKADCSKIIATTPQQGADLQLLLVVDKHKYRRNEKNYIAAYAAE